ncbi:MAG: (Fe-S)-binding protein [Candidatus Electrothrix aestuarii]|uniref:Glycolate oxidase iron-sulfur subunit n=1 Tax=Candidatus Electrothrix aestuarii TaxID=3062594 RepID=A0AAU8LUJ8_9BACT|nr:(Fe-S)-binding protein [Candidatus Electrothrix aestuarii]
MAAAIAGAGEIRCAKCGACAVVCPVYRVDGREVLTARGKMHLLNSQLSNRPTNIFTDLFSRCLLCGACKQVCPRGLPITELISQARSTFPPLYGPNSLKKALFRKTLSHPSLLEGLVKAGINLRHLPALPSSSGLRLKLGLVEKRERKVERVPLSLEQKKEVRQKKQQTPSFSYFTGCFARHLQPSIIDATQELLSFCDINNAFPAHIPTEQHCCGLAAWSAGDMEQARSLAQKNIQAFAGSSNPIITSCASCSAHLLSYPKLFTEDDPWHAKTVTFAKRVREFTSFFADALPYSVQDNAPKKKVYYHAPCHLRFKDKGMSTPRALLKKAGVSVLEPEKSPLCCGQGGLFRIASPELSAQIFEKSSKQALADAPDCITTTCSGCLMQFQEGMARQGQKVQVIHMAVMLADCLKKCS